MSSKRPSSARPHAAQRTSTGRGSRRHDDDDEDLEYECKACYLVILDDLDDEINSKEQLSKLLNQAGRNPTKRMLNKYWPHNTECLTFEDFVDICRKEPATTEDDIIGAFRKIDLNGDGYISLDELYKVMTTRGEKMTRSEVRAIIDEVDENKDGRLDYKESVIWFNQFSKMILDTQQEAKSLAKQRYEKKGKTRKDGKRDDYKRESKSNRKSYSNDDSEEETDHSGSNLDKGAQNLSRSSRPYLDSPQKSHRKSSPQATRRRGNSPQLSMRSSPQLSYRGSGSPQLKHGRNESPRGGSERRTTRDVSPSESRKRGDRSQNEASGYDSLMPQTHSPRMEEKHRRSTTRGSDHNDDDDDDDDIVLGSTASLQTASKSSSGPVPKPRPRREREQENRERSRDRDRDHDRDRSSRGDDADNREFRKDAVASKRLKLPDPRNIKARSMVHYKGCFFLEEDGNVISHQYQLSLPEDSSVHITIEPYSVKMSGGAMNSSREVGGAPIDTMVFLMREKPDIEGRRVVTFTEKRDTKGRYCVKCDLKKGKYNLVPFTSKCRLKQRKSKPRAETKLVRKKDDKNILSKPFKDALTEIFEMCDLDGNGRLSREEFSLFNVRTSGEELGDEEWEVVKENVELKNDELTLKGFLDLNQLEAEDSGNDTEDLWANLTGMGFNKALELDEACPFMLEVYAESSDRMKIKVNSLDSPRKKLEAALVEIIMDKGEMSRVKGMKDLFLHTYHNDFMVAVAVENKSYSRVSMSLDCSSSRNIISNNPDLDATVELNAKSASVGHVLMPLNERQDWTVKIVDSILK